MNYLIGDIGNTNIKICKINKNFKIINTYLFNTKSLHLEKEINKKFKNINKVVHTNVLFSSVVPKAFKKIKKVLQKKKLKVFEIKNFNLKKMLNFKVKKFSELGSDRIANSIAAFKKFKKNCIIIDFGTATTFDIIKKNKSYEGGLIAPGINLSIENLFSSTALLPMFDLKKYPKNYGKNTKEALAAGFFWGYEGLINNIIKKIIKKKNKSFVIILTGGYANLFKNRLTKNSKVEKDITIKGIIEIYKSYLL